jgi:RNA polymerase sigma factor (sigma-70 family)
MDEIRIKSDKALIKMALSKFLPLRFDSALSKEDYMQIANIGLWKARNNFNIEKHKNWNIYAIMMMRWEILGEVNSLGLTKTHKREIRQGRELPILLTSKDSIEGDIERFLDSPSLLLDPEFDELGFIKSSLNEAEIFILEKVLAGFSYIEIAKELSISSPRQIYWMWQKTIKKLRFLCK